ncbi:hypothetical protein ACFL59_08325 [Planctomycetota bacterium]
MLGDLRVGVDGATLELRQESVGGGYGVRLLEERQVAPPLALGGNGALKELRP